MKSKNNKMDDWNILIWDNGEVDRVKDFVSGIWRDPVTVRPFVSMDEETFKKNKKKGSKATKNISGKVLTLYGDGCYHHYTYGLVNSFLNQGKGKFSFGKNDYLYVHIDYHTDMWDFTSNDTGPGSSDMDCASFVNKLEGKPDILLLGCDAGPHKVKKRARIMYQEDLLSKRMGKQLRKYLQRSDKENVYVSMDLDVMHVDDVLTSFGQGEVMLENMFDILDIIGEEKEICGADVLGYSGTLSSRRDISSLITYAALSAKVCGKDTSELLRLKRDYYHEAYVTLDRYSEIKEGLII